MTVFRGCRRPVDADADDVENDDSDDAGDDANAGSGRKESHVIDADTASAAASSPVLCITNRHVIVYSRRTLQNTNVTPRKKCCQNYDSTCANHRHVNVPGCFR